MAVKYPNGFMRTIFSSVGIGASWEGSFILHFHEGKNSQRTLARALKIPEWIYSLEGVSEISTFSFRVSCGGGRLPLVISEKDSDMAELVA